MRIAVSWSGGKDSALVHTLLRQKGHEVVLWLTTYAWEDGKARVVGHGIELKAIQAQADAAGVALWAVEIPPGCVNPVYEKIMQETCLKLQKEGIEAIAFGDIHLADVRAYREKNLAKTGLQPLFPLWGLPSHAVCEAFLEQKGEAILVKVYPPIASDWQGKHFSVFYRARGWEGVDPAGEYGEYHTYVISYPFLWSGELTFS